MVLVGLFLGLVTSSQCRYLLCTDPLNLTAIPNIQLDVQLIASPSGVSPKTS